MKQIILLPSFFRSAKKLTSLEKKNLKESLGKLNSYLETGQAPYGWRFKKLDQGKYEFRVDIRLRVMAKVEDDVLFLVLVGSHDEIHRYLKRNR